MIHITIFGNTGVARGGKRGYSDRKYWRSYRGHKGVIPVGSWRVKQEEKWSKPLYTPITYPPYNDISCAKN